MGAPVARPIRVAVLREPLLLDISPRGHEVKLEAGGKATMTNHKERKRNLLIQFPSLFGGKNLVLERGKKSYSSSLESH